MVPGLTVGAQKVGTLIYQFTDLGHIVGVSGGVV